MTSEVIEACNVSIRCEDVTEAASKIAIIDAAPHVDVRVVVFDVLKLNGDEGQRDQ